MVLILIITGLVANLVSANPELTISEGSIRGTTGTNLNGETFYKFLGIPYAKPPVGSLRFKAPQPSEPWIGTKECTKDAATCIQRDFFGSEDCLYLNVFTRTIPEQQNITLKPVMVAFHAGGYILGSGTQDMQPAEYLLTEDVVLVSINYRLGVFGFLSLDNVDLEVPGNAGLKDQILALKWVQKNIAKFNGDPNNVTVFGVSAGGASVQFMMLSSSAKGLFHKAIIESGSVLNPWAWGQKNGVQLAQKLQQNVTNEAEALKVLVNASAKEVFQSSLQFPGVVNVDISHVRRPFGPVIEKPNPTAFITQDPLQLLQNRVINDVPLLVGVCSNEGLIEDIGIFFGGDRCLDPVECSVLWMMNVNRDSKQFEDIQEKVRGFYFKDNSTKASIQDLFSDVIITEGVLSSAKLQFKNNKSPMYFYVLDYETPMIRKFKQGINLDNQTDGLPHASDYFFLFKTQIIDNIVTVEEDRKAIRKMVKMWTDFAKTGHPHPQWHPVEDSNNIDYFHIKESPEMKQGPFRKRMEFWESLKQEYPLNFRTYEKVSCTNEDHPEVTIKQGTIRGTTATNLNGDIFYKFLGIPYSKPPINSLRFKAPLPAEPWIGTKNCTQDGAICMQYTPKTGLMGSEDCLYLNVFTQTLPGKVKNSLKPVMVAFHAGGYVLGSGQMQQPEALLTEDVVLVTINYRLGVFGFLSLDDVNLDVPGNAGLKDQRLALKWVQENISKFNGDPDNVTIFGISAGGASVQFMASNKTTRRLFLGTFGNRDRKYYVQLLSPSAKGFFHKAIIQSGSVLNPWAWGQKNAIHLAQKLQKNVTDESEALSILNQASSTEVFEASLKFPQTLSVDQSNTKRPFGPVIETSNPTVFISEDPLDLLRSGTVNDVPLILGVCSNEGLIRNLGSSLGINTCLDPLQCSVPWMISNHSEIAQRAVKEFYFKDKITNTSLSNLFGDVIITEGVISSAKFHLLHNKNPVYFYVLDYETPMIQAFKQSINVDSNTTGLPHSADSLFLLHNPVSDSPEDVRGVKKMVTMWTQFAKTGRPHPEWNSMEDPRKFDYFLIRETAEMRQNPFKERMDFWTNFKEES